MTANAPEAAALLSASAARNVAKLDTASGRLDSGTRSGTAGRVFQICVVEYMVKQPSDGLVHKLPSDFVDALTATSELVSHWESLTPIARNEFICWVEDAKRETTRAKRIRRAVEELLEGQKRPCCWAGCIHRTDKKPSKWQQDVLIDKKPGSKVGKNRSRN